MKIFRRLGFVALILMVSLARSFSSNLNQCDSLESYSLRQDSKAVQFFLINEIAVGYKFHLSPFSAVQLRSDVSAHVSNTTVTNAIIFKANDSTSSSPGFSEKNNGGTVQISACYLFYLNPADRFSFFVGLGPFVSYGKGITEDDYSDDSHYYTRTNYDLWAGIFGTAGFEFSVYDKISLIGNYELSASYGESETEYDGNTQAYKRIARQINRSVQLSSIRIGLALYF